MGTELIKELRDRTGAGIMACRDALISCNNNLDSACDYLRKKGLTKVASKASRIAAEGLALTRDYDNLMVIAEVNCETDFVSRSNAFHELVDNTLDLIAQNNPSTLENAIALTADEFANATLKMGEKLSLRRFEVLQKVDGQFIYSYSHMGGRNTSVVVLDKDDPELAKGLCMSVINSKPQYLFTDDISQEDIDHEKSIQLELVKNDPKLNGKPQAMLDNIINNKVKKYLSELVFMLKPYIYDDSKTIEDVLKSKGVHILKIINYTVGEGIEK